MKIAGKWALITGAAHRLGRAIAISLAERGVNILVHYNKSSLEAESLCDIIRAMGCEAHPIYADLGDPLAVEDAFSHACKFAGEVDILVNNASIFPEATLWDFTEADLLANIRVNAFAPLVLSRALARQRIEGCIINLLDARMMDYDARHAAYHLSKRMLFTLTRMMALEFAPLVRVNAIAPGLILPPPGGDDAWLQSMAHTNPLERVGGPDDVTRSLLFLLDSPFITGQVIFTDGGRHMKGSVYG